MKVVLVLLLVLPFSWGGFAAELIDATGVRVQIDGTPSRIVTLAPSLAEIAADVLQSDLNKIVGVSDRTDFPPALSKVPSIGSFASFSLEMVLSLKPDLVIATTDGNPRDRVERLRELGIRVLVVKNSTLIDLSDSIALIAEALGKKALGLQLQARFRSELTRISEESKKLRNGGTPPRVLLQIGTDPIVVAGKNSFLNEMIQIVGAENVYGNLESTYPKPSIEDVLRRDPKWVLVIGMERDEKYARKVVKEWEDRALKRSGQSPRNVVILPGDSLLRPSPRLLEGLRLLKSTLYAGAL